ncbi:MAG TPA: hypothetical protein OQH54_01420 [Nitrosopumilus sp.]|nr:hypothetical protein [Thermoproteota archaeon]HJJ22365.1 hypothetical protein [Nitrosopumilus sp.]
MQNHQKLTIAGGILLVITYLIFNYHEVHPGIEFNYAYISGIVMIIAFMVSFGLFYKDRFKSKNE